MAKECLIAAHELGLTQSGEYVFVVFELDIISGHVRQQKPFKWGTADFTNENDHTDNYQRFMERSSMLCNAWESALLMMTRLPDTDSMDAKKTLSNFYDSVRKGMRKWFNSSVYEGTIKATNYSKEDSKPPNQAMTLYDAIRFYAIAVDDTIRKRENYRDGRTVMRNLKNQLFTSIRGYQMVFDRNGEVQVRTLVYFFTLYSYM